MLINIKLYEHHWWVLLLKGGLAVVFGILTIMIDHYITLPILYIYFGLMLLFSGIFILVASFFHFHKKYWDLTLIEGGFDIAFALMVLLLPSFTEMSVYIIIGLYTLIIGAAQGYTALKAKQRTIFWVAFAFNALISLVFVLLLFVPSLRTESFLIRSWEVYLIIIGISVIIGASRLRQKA